MNYFTFKNILLTFILISLSPSTAHGMLQNMPPIQQAALAYGSAGFLTFVASNSSFDSRIKIGVIAGALAGAGAIQMSNSLLPIQDYSSSRNQTLTKQIAFRNQWWRKIGIFIGSPLIAASPIPLWNFVNRYSPDTKAYLLVGSITTAILFGAYNCYQIRCESHAIDEANKAIRHTQESQIPVHGGTSQSSLSLQCIIQ